MGLLGEHLHVRRPCRPGWLRTTTEGLRETGWGGGGDLGGEERQAEKMRTYRPSALTKRHWTYEMKCKKKEKKKNLGYISRALC